MTELVEIDGLHEMVVDACLARAPAVFLLAPAGERDQRQVAAVGALPRTPRDLEAVHAGHADVEQHHRGPKGFELVERGRPVAGGVHVGAEALEQHREALRSVAAVVDDENALRGERGLARAGLPVATFRTVDAERQPHDELAAAAEPFTLRGDGAAVQLDQGAYEREADAEPALRTLIRAVRLREQIENARQHVDGNADAAVAHRHDGMVAFAAPGEPDLPAFLRVLGRVVQQVGDDLRKPHRIRNQGHGLVRHGHRQLVMRRLDQRAARLDGALEHRAEVDGLLAQLDAAPRHARDLHEIVDEPDEVVHLALEHLVDLRGGGRVEPRRAQDLQAVANRRERIAQLVSERGEELVLAPVRLA